MQVNNIDRLKSLLGNYETTEERLYLSNAYLAAIFEHAHEAMLAKNLDRIITAWNPAAERLYGYSSVEAIGRDVAIIVPSEKMDELNSIMDRLRNGIFIPPFQTVRQRNDGVKINVVLTISPIIDRTGRVIGASAIAHPEGDWNTVMPYDSSS